MSMLVNIVGQVKQIKLPVSKALWPIFEAIVNSIQSLEDTDIKDKKIIVEAQRPTVSQLAIDSNDNNENNEHFTNFIITDNGQGFNKLNYSSFLEAYSQLKIEKGCKGIGRFLWLKAFESVEINSTYIENGVWKCRNFIFSLNGIEKEEETVLEANKNLENQTTIKLKNFKDKYRNNVTSSSEELGKSIIEHCLLYFLLNKCPKIELKDNFGKQIILNDYYKTTLKDQIHQDNFTLNNRQYTIFHFLKPENGEKHELHLCANNREVKSFDLKNYVPNMQKKLEIDGNIFYYVGYLTGEYLDSCVNIERSEFNFWQDTLFEETNENQIVSEAVSFIKTYLCDDLKKIAEQKKSYIDEIVKSEFPQYRYLLNNKPEIYDEITPGLPKGKLDIELYKHQQQWELEIAENKQTIENSLDNNDDDKFQEIFNDYCKEITELSKASLAEYVAKRKAIIDVFSKALEIQENDKYNKESTIHKIICPMQKDSDEIIFDDMNLWLIDDRLAYQYYLASDKKISSLKPLENNSEKRMDLAIFNTSLSYTNDAENINSITIIEFKRPQRNDESNDPVWQVLEYVEKIKSGKVKKANGRDFGDMTGVSFYCYIIGDLTDSMKKSAKRYDLTLTPDGKGYFGYHKHVGAYVEIISFDKLVKDAKQRNKSLFNKLFNPKLEDIEHLELLNNENKTK